MAMLSRLSIRQRLLIFGAIWLTGCTLLLTSYLVSEARRSLLQSAVERSHIIATRLAEEARIHLHAGNHEAVEALLRDITKQPDILMATIDQKDRSYGNRSRNIKALSPSQGLTLGDSHLVMVGDLRAIESTAPILFPSRTDVLSDEVLFGGGQESEGRDQARVVLSVEPIFEQMTTLVTDVLIFCGVLLCFGLLVGWVVSGTMISPLRRLVARARVWTIAEGTPAGSGVPHGPDEINLIWNSLSTMKRSLDRKTAEIAQLQVGFEDKLRKRTADIEEINRHLSDILRLKNDLILQLSHEVKTPLTALIGLVANLHDGLVGPITHRQKDYLECIKSISDRIKRLLSALLQFAIAETGKIPLDRRPLPMSEMAQQVLIALQSIQEERGVPCVIGESMHGKYAFADRDRVEQILLNLVHNAIKASPAGSTVVIEAQEMETELMVIVRDSGSGICPSDQPRLLREHLCSERSQGGGVGLYISHYLVELHGGRIWFESQEGKGTTFFFTLPKSLPPVEAGI